MTSFCVHHREEYEKACRALTRMMRDTGTAMKNVRKLDRGSERGSWPGQMSLRTDSNSGPEPPTAAPMLENSRLDEAHANEEDLIEIPPDVMKGWLLLEKSGLNGLKKKSVIQLKCRDGSDHQFQANHENELAADDDAPCRGVVQRVLPGLGPGEPR